MNSCCNRRGFLISCGAIGLAVGASFGAVKWATGRNRKATVSLDNRTLHLASRKGVAMGSAVEMIVLHEEPATANAALDAAFAELARVEKLMSIYLPDSQLSRLNRAGSLHHADDYLLQVLAAARDMGDASEGAFDVTVQPLWQTYAAAARDNALPSQAQIDAATRLVDYRNVLIAGHTVTLKKPGMAVTLNGIAQGFAADRVMNALKSAGIRHALVNTGEFASTGNKADGNPWTLGIQHPRNPEAYLGLAKLQGRCLSTSGDYQTAFSSDKKYNHIFEPSTGKSPDAFSSVTVVAPSATEADALSTAIFVLGPDKGMLLVEKRENVDVLMVMKDGRQLATRNFPWA